MKFLTLSILLVCITVCLAADGFVYDYEVNGPDVWFKQWYTCSHSEQSPINIEQDHVEYADYLEEIELKNYDRVVNWTVYKGSHNVGFKVGDGYNDVHTISDHDKMDHQLIGGHFHWGYNSYQGSEHTVDGKKYPLELHLVHLDEETNVMVLGFLFELDTSDNSMLTPLLNALSKVESEGDQVNQAVNIVDLLPKNIMHYYRYSGSFTTPPCTEGVKWTVFDSTIKISENQMKVFHDLAFLKLNFREPQPINKRKVCTNWKMANEPKTTFDHIEEYFSYLVNLFSN